MRILIEGIGRHAVAGDPEESTRFQSSIQKESEAVVDEITPEDLLVRAGSVLKELEEYNRTVARRHHLNTAEFRNMVKMLTSAVGTVAAASEVNVSILTDIGKQVAVTSELDDVRIMKARLSDCLTNIRKEAERQQTDTEGLSGGSATDSASSRNEPRTLRARRGNTRAKTPSRVCRFAPWRKLHSPSGAWTIPGLLQPSWCWIICRF